MNPIIEFSKVTKGYSFKKVLDRLDLKVSKGTVMGLVGKNGAGKSTLLKCALGLLKPQEGSITTLGCPAWDLDEHAKERLGYVPQVIQLYPWMRVPEIISYTASFYPRWDSTLIKRLVVEWELNPLVQVKTLSPGQIQKLAILLAIGHGPELLVLDEPAASLDPVARRQFLKTLLEMTSQEERTVLFSTHITSDLERVADSVAILIDGKIAYAGGLGELKESVKQLHITASRPFPQPINIPGLLKSRIQGNEALLTVQDANEGLVPRLEKQLGASVQVKSLNLEDIFLEFHHE